MKKVLFTLMVLAGFAVAASAQPRAVGGRISNGLEASYQHGLGDKNMIQVDAGFYAGWGIGGQAVATYDWIFPINSWKEKGEWNWYAGVGLGAGASTWGGFVGAAGLIGVEYTFWFPLQLSLDYRPIIGPEFHWGGGVGFNFWGLYGNNSFGLSARYKF